MNLTAEGGIAQGMVLASLIGGFALAVIGALVAAFPRQERRELDAPLDRALACLAVAATVMMVNVWTGIVFFVDDGGDRGRIAPLFYLGLFVGVGAAGLGLAEMLAIRAPSLRRVVWSLIPALLAAVVGPELASSGRGDQIGCAHGGDTHGRTDD